MAATTNATLLADLFDPQVVADYIDAKLIDAIRLSPLARIDTSLVGRPGDEVTLPQYAYVGDAEAVAEGADIPIAKLSQSVDRVKIAKVGRAVEFSDEALLSGHNNDIAEQAARQVADAINSTIENNLIAKMGDTATLATSIAANAANPADGIADALTLFGEDLDGEKVLAIPPEFYAKLRKSESWIPNTELGANAIVRGTIGMVHGCQVVSMNRLRSVTHATYAPTSDTSVSTSKTYYEKTPFGYIVVENPVEGGLSGYYEKSTATGASAFIVKPGALAIFLKRDTLVEFDRDIIAEMNYIKASKLSASYVYDKSKLIKIALPSS